MRMTYFLRDNGACGYYRAELPFLTAKRNRAADIFKIEKGDTQDHILKGLDADIVMIPRVSETNMLQVMCQLQADGKKVVLDYDDNMFEISPFSPHYEEFGIENVEVELNGEKIPLWVDGKNIDLKRNKETLDAVIAGVSLADMVTVTTEKLAEVYLQYNKNVKILPNCVDTRIWKNLPLRRSNDKEVRLFWAGGSSHYQDWCLLKDVLPVVMDKYPNAKLVLLGTKFDGTLKDINPEQIEFHPWVHTAAYPYKTAILDPDIAIVPLEDNTFNQCKSAIKFIEMGALGVPSVCSLVSPYKEMYDGTNGVFIEDNNPLGWIKGISTLIEDRLLRAKLGGNAQKTVNQYFDINTQYTQWVDTYKELLDGN